MTPPPWDWSIETKLVLTMGIAPSSLLFGSRPDTPLTTLFIEWVVLGPPIIVLFYIVLNEIVRYQSRIAHLPGPRGYPLLGSLPSLHGKHGAEEYRKWAAEYGDVFQLQLGNKTAVVVNSVSAARELFIGQREATNGRPIFYVLHKKVQRGGPVTSIGTSLWDDSCKRRRKLAAGALNKANVVSYFPVS